MYGLQHQALRQTVNLYALQRFNTAPKIKETYLVPEDENELDTHTTIVNTTSGGASTAGLGGDESCTIRYEPCRIGWACALTEVQ